MNDSLHIALCTSLDEVQKACDLFQQVWSGGPTVVPMDLGVAMVHAGGYCALATYQGRVVGASLGFLGQRGTQQVLHSHVTASTIAGTGFAMKQHQKAWALEHGLSGITWTFDPLVRRNSYFNLVKLAATGIEFLPEFYGPMTDDINAGDLSDRVLCLWDITKPRESTTSDSLRHTALAQHDANPVVHGVQPGIENVIELPADFEALRALNHPSVPKWRLAMRECLDPYLNQGWTLTGMMKKEALILSPPQESA